MVFSQPPLERALREHIARCPQITVALQTEMLSYQQNADHVTAQLCGPQGNELDIQAQWLVGCDGGSSTVRALAGIELQDLGFDEPWLVVDVMVNDQGLAKLPQVSVQYCEPERPSTLVIGPGRHRRWEISLKAGEDPQRMATPEHTWRLLSRWLTPQDGELWRQSSYRFHALVAQQWRQGRVFLAGDAAHMQPPFLGQGMCQGIRDATNLAWKLIAVSRHSFTPEKTQALLDSYCIERKAHVIELTSRIKKIGEVICERDLQRALQRDADMLAACAGTVPDTPRQDVMPALSSGMLSAVPGSGRGSLFPQPRLLSPDALMDDVMGHGWRWVTDGTWALPDDTSGWTVCNLSDRCAEREGVVQSWLSHHQGHAALIRPDHHVFGVATSKPQVQALRDEWLQWMPMPR
jgi:3-(3-hydroxy-phenyl)propionate hydroxylase